MAALIYNKEDDTFTLSSDYFAELLGKLVAATKGQPDSTAQAMDAAYKQRFPHGDRLTSYAGTPLTSSRPKYTERTPVERAEYEERFPNARRLSSGI